MSTLSKIRTIKPEFFFDSELATLNIQTRLLFIGLWLYADREGRLLDDPKRIRAVLFPYHPNLNIDKMLTELSHKPFIYRYAANSRKYIQIVRWKEHQRVHHTEKESTIPPPNGDFTVNQPLINGENPVGREGKGMEGKGMEDATPPKVKHREFVYLTEREYTTLCDNIGKGNTDSYIARLNDYIGAKGKKYNSHYHVISGWYRRDNPEDRPRKQL